MLVFNLNITGDHHCPMVIDTDDRRIIANAYNQILYDLILSLFLNTVDQSKFTDVCHGLIIIFHIFPFQFEQWFLTQELQQQYFRQKQQRRSRRSHQHRPLSLPRIDMIDTADSDNWKPTFLTNLFQQ